MIVFNIECFDFHLKSFEISMILLPFFSEKSTFRLFFNYKV